MVKAFLSVGKRFLWNIDARVGLNSPNRADDVQLIQFGYTFLAKNRNFPDEQRAVFAAVRVGIPCTGQDSDPLVRAITVHQHYRGGTIDGHITPAINTPS